MPAHTSFVARFLPPERSAPLDIARCLAIIGMVCAHVVMGARNPAQDFISMLVSAPTAALFTFVAGISLGIMTGGDQPLKGQAMLSAYVRIVVRSPVLLSLVTLIFLVDLGVQLILANFAFWFLFSLPFLRMSARKLVWSIAVMVVILPVALPLLGSALTALFYAPHRLDGVFFMAFFSPEGYSAASHMPYLLAGLAYARFGITRSDRRAHLLAQSGAALGIFLTFAGFITSTLITSFQAGTPTTRLGESWIQNISSQELLVFRTQGQDGLDKMREELHSRALAFQQDAGIGSSQEALSTSSDELLSASSSELAGLWLEDRKEKFAAFMDSLSWPSILENSVVSIAPHNHSVLETVGNLGLSTLIVSLLMLLPPLALRCLFPLAVMGSMSLTLYCLHIPWITFTNVVNWGWTTSFLGGITLLLTFAMLWRSFSQRGPLESLTHSLSWRAVHSLNGEENMGK